jgi:hypothetical protein
VALSWIFHQAADIHQPLHAVARFSKALPAGDRGGNEVKLPDPQGRAEFRYNLHAYWDNALGRDEDPAAVERLADSLMAEYPRASLADEVAKSSITEWAEESVAASVKTVYGSLDPNITDLPALPAGYETDARKVARRRAALAGYRLSDELKRLYSKE